MGRSESVAAIERLILDGIDSRTFGVAGGLVVKDSATKGLLADRSFEREEVGGHMQDIQPMKTCCVGGRTRADPLPWMGVEAVVMTG